VPTEPVTSFTCPACAHVDPIEGDPAKQVLKCDACGARIAYGHVQARVMVGPDAADARFTIVQAQAIGPDGKPILVDGKPGVVQLRLDRQYAQLIGRNMLALG
jgi:hypothetical protein